MDHKKFRKFARDILNGLHYLHNQRVVHGDVRGANILLTTVNIDTCTLKLADIGDLKRVLNNEAGKHFRRQVNTDALPFMSPEMIRVRGGSSRTKFGRKTDVWSFGCVLIEMLTGQAPRFAGNSADEKPKIVESWPKDVRRLLDECFENNPARRPSTQDMSAKDLFTGIELAANDKRVKQKKENTVTLSTYVRFQHNSLRRTLWNAGSKLFCV